MISTNGNKIYTLYTKLYIQDIYIWYHFFNTSMTISLDEVRTITGKADMVFFIVVLFDPTKLSFSFTPLLTSPASLLEAPNICTVRLPPRNQEKKGVYTFEIFPPLHSLNQKMEENKIPKIRAAPIHPARPHLSPRRNHAKPAPHSGSKP